MWILYAKAPPPDAVEWPGRRWLAALDAMGWPAAVVWLLASVPHAGLLAPVGMSLGLLSALNRLHVALWHNQRYQFTTWRWARVVSLLLVVGMALKVTAHW
jgi:hypothetical protein